MFVEDFEDEELTDEEKELLENQELQDVTTVEDPNKASLTAFIFCCVALFICSFWIIGPIVSVVLVFLARDKLSTAQYADKQPYIVFYRICKIAWWVILILAILAFIGWGVSLVFTIIAAISRTAIALL